MDRARLLLSRAKSVYRCLEGYLDRGYSVILPQDEIWPKRLFALGDRMPRFLFLRGDQALLSRRMVAVAGRRDIDDSVSLAACRLGQQIALEGFCMVSGGARGVDTAAENGLLDAGGSMVLVPAVPDSRLMSDARAAALDEGRLLMAYDSLPDDPFSAQRALARNHMI